MNVRSIEQACAGVVSSSQPSIYFLLEVCRNGLIGGGTWFGVLKPAFLTGRVSTLHIMQRLGVCNVDDGTEDPDGCFRAMQLC